MTMTFTEISVWVSSIMWPLMRVGAMLAVAPVFGARTVPVRIRVLFGFVLAWLLSILLPSPPVVDLLSLEMVIISLHEIMIGLVMGFILQMVFGILAMAGENIAFGMGLGFASMVDPQNGIQIPVLGQYYLVLATLIFLALDGHLVVMDVLFHSFVTLPIGGGGIAQDGLWGLVSWGAQMFEGALLISLPVVASLLLVNISFGIITRSAPQLNIFAVGFPLILLIGFALIFLSLPTLGPLFEQIMFDGFVLIQLLIGGGG
jgi:flagellar biosynthetic protein FliR